MSSTPTRVLVVDDTAIYRKIVRQALAGTPDIEVIGTAPNGVIALDKIAALKPDVVTLDIEMPELDGLGVLRRLREQGSPVGVIMLSALTTTGADATIQALNLGAFDMVLKPSGADLAKNTAELRRQLCEKIEAFAGSRHAAAPASQALSTGPQAAPGGAATPARPKTVAVAAPGTPQVIGLGTSTGGPEALGRMMPKLPADLPVPLLIVQHMPPTFTRSLAESLDARCAIGVCEASEGQPIEPGQAYIAPGGHQMKVVRDGCATLIRITDDPPENCCRPSVDYLFRSLSLTYGGDAVAVIMTGMGSDGALGCRLLKRRGATIITQSEETCVVYGMPREPTAEGLADTVTPLEHIADTIRQAVRKGAAVCK